MSEPFEGEVIAWTHSFGFIRPDGADLDTLHRQHNDMMHEAHKGNEAMPKNTDFTKRIIPLFVIVMIGWALVISLLRWVLSWVLS